MAGGGAGVRAVPVARLVRFELRRRWHAGRLPVALVLLGACSVAVGLARVAGHLLLDDAVRLWGYAQLVSLALVYRFDLAHDMDHGFADAVAPNLVAVPPFIVGRLAAGFGALACFSAAAALVTWMAPGLDLRFALWNSVLWFLVATAAAPPVLLAEIWLRTRVPVLAVVLLAGIAALSAAGVGALPQVGRLTGSHRISYGSFVSLVGFAWRGCALGLAGLATLTPLLARHWAPGPQWGQFPNGSSSEGLCGVNSSAPSGVITMSSSRRTPNSPGM